MKITKQHLGKRLLVKKRVAYYTDPCEVGLLEVSPSGHYVKIQFVRADDTTYTDWVLTENYDLIEVLASKAEQISDIAKEFNKKYTPYTDTSEQYAKEARKAHAREIKKNKWVHGICNPSSANWKVTNGPKEYVEHCKPTGKKYYCVQDMVRDLSNMKFNLEVPGVEE